MEKILFTHKLGDMQACYVLNEENDNIELVLLPIEIDYEEREREKPYSDNIVQVKLVGDTYMGAYAPGITMRQSESTLSFTYDKQEVNNTNGEMCIDTYLKDGRNHLIIHHLIYRDNERVVRSYTTFENQSEDVASLELLSSFSLGKISPLMEGDGYDTMHLHRIRSVWSMEGRVETSSLEELQLEPSWGGHAVRCERFGATGSLPVNNYFPIAVLEDRKNSLFWGVQIAHNASWQMEIYRRGDYIQLSGGLADREFGHWMKNIGPGESFDTPQAILSVCQTNDKEEIYGRLTSSLDNVLDEGVPSEQTLPVMFNEYCTTWGNPSHDNITDIVNTIKGKGFEYFVIDCGWYKQEGIPWDVSMGEYEVSKELFPDGLEKTVKLIKDAGMKPGIWFEIDNVGSKSNSYNQHDLLLKRDGRALTTTMRRFWDLRKSEVQDILKEKVIDTLNKYGFEYMKMDCNDTIGIGVDGAESLGEGLRQNQASSIDFIRRVKKEVPGIILENCASGGHKLEPLMMSECSMASFSDAHECEEIPIIAANLHRVILPRQSQIWAVIRETDSLKRIAYSVINTFLGRMCISGDVWRLSKDQWDVVEKGIDFYKKIAHIIKYGKTYFYGSEIKSYRHPKGWQGIFRESIDENSAFITLHGFEDVEGKSVEMKIKNGYRIESIYSDSPTEIMLNKDTLSYKFETNKKAVAVYLVKEQ